MLQDNKEVEIMRNLEANALKSLAIAQDRLNATISDLVEMYASISRVSNNENNSRTMCIDKLFLFCKHI